MTRSRGALGGGAQVCMPWGAPVQSPAPEEGSSDARRAAARKRRRAPRQLALRPLPAEQRTLGLFEAEPPSSHASGSPNRNARGKR